MARSLKSATISKESQSVALAYLNGRPGYVPALTQLELSRIVRITEMRLSIRTPSRRMVQNPKIGELDARHCLLKRSLTRNARP